MLESTRKIDRYIKTIEKCRGTLILIEGFTILR